MAKTRIKASKLRLYKTPIEVTRSLSATLSTMPGSSAATQEDRLEIELHKWSLTTFDMARDLGLYDPRARIKGLRNKGLNIVRSWVNIETDCGEQHRVGLFTLMRGGK